MKHSLGAKCFKIHFLLEKILACLGG